MQLINSEACMRWQWLLFVLFSKFSFFHHISLNQDRLSDSAAWAWLSLLSPLLLYIKYIQHSLPVFIFASGNGIFAIYVGIYIIIVISGVWIMNGLVYGRLWMASSATRHLHLRYAHCNELLARTPPCHSHFDECLFPNEWHSWSHPRSDSRPCRCHHHFRVAKQISKEYIKCSHLCEYLWFDNSIISS